MAKSKRKSAVRKAVKKPLAKQVLGFVVHSPTKVHHASKSPTCEFC